MGSTPFTSSRKPVLLGLLLGLLGCSRELDPGPAPVHLPYAEQLVLRGRNRRTGDGRYPTQRFVLEAPAAVLVTAVGFWQDWTACGSRQYRIALVEEGSALETKPQILRILAREDGVSWQNAPPGVYRLALYTEQNDPRCVLTVRLQIATGGG